MYWKFPAEAWPNLFHPLHATTLTAFDLISNELKICTHTLTAKYQPKRLHNALLFGNAFYQFLENESHFQQ